jgi:hypothetical protein
MNKLTNAYLLQGNKKFTSIIAVDLRTTVSVAGPHKSKGPNVWKIFLDMDNVWGLHKICKKNSMFQLFIEYTLKDDNGKPIIETVQCEMEVTDIVPSRSPNGPNSVKGISSNLIASSKEAFIWEKVQFD